MALRMGVQLGAFQAIRDGQDKGTTTEQIAEKSGASVFVVGRFDGFPVAAVSAQTGSCLWGSTSVDGSTPTMSIPACPKLKHDRR